MSEILDIRPLCTLFPEMPTAEFDDMSGFSGMRADGLFMADFSVSDWAPDHWDYDIIDVNQFHHLKSRRPIASMGVALILDQFGGARNWLLSPCSKSLTKNARVAELPAVTPPGTEIVYFLKAGDFIKIGKATGSPEYRVSQLKTGCPFPITTLGYMTGGIKEESRLHKRFAAFRAHGEWFRAEPELLEFIESIRKKA